MRSVGKLEVKCYHCGHEWTYTGNMQFYITCPNCRYKLSLKKLKER